MHLEWHKASPEAFTTKLTAILRGEGLLKAVKGGLAIGLWALMAAMRENLWM